MPDPGLQEVKDLLLRINYREGGKACRKAWFFYKKSQEHTGQKATSVPDFVAGWNAAIDHEKQDRKE